MSLIEPPVYILFYKYIETDGGIVNCLELQCNLRHSLTLKNLPASSVLGYILFKKNDDYDMIVIIEFNFNFINMLMCKRYF